MRTIEGTANTPQSAVNLARKDPPAPLKHATSVRLRKLLDGTSIPGF